MGIASSKKSEQSPNLRASDIKIKKFQFSMDKKPTILREEWRSLGYSTPCFRALAVVKIPPLPDGANIQVGWIQVCTEMKFTNTYGDYGFTSWEFPELVSGKYEMVNDSDGKRIPWYWPTDAVTDIEGPTNCATTKELEMYDNFDPEISWIPFGTGIKEPCLVYVHRKQIFYLYLILKDVNTDTYEVIKTITWSMELAIDVNPRNPLSQRARLLEPYEQEKPRVVPKHLTPPLKCNALKPPNGNSCQALVWRPKTGDPMLIVKPVETTMDMDEYIKSTKDDTRLLPFPREDFLLGRKKSGTRNK